MLTLALPFLVLQLTGSGILMGVVGMAETLPLFLFAIPAGLLADWGDRHSLIIMADFGRAALWILIPVSLWLNHGVMITILFVVFITSLLGVVFNSAYLGSEQALWPTSQLNFVNSYIEAGESAAYMIGPVITGAMIHFWSITVPLILNALSFALSGSLLRKVIPRSPTTPLFSLAPSWSSITKDMKEAMSWIRKNSLLKEATILWAFHRLIFASLIPALTYLVIHSFHDSSPYLGLIITLYAAGSLVGTFLQPHTPGQWPLWNFVAMALSGIAACVAGLWGAIPWVLMASIGSLGCSEGYILVYYLTKRSMESQPSLSGRIYSITAGITQGFGSLGFLITGTLLSLLGAPQTWDVMGTSALLTAAMFIISRWGKTPETDLPKRPS